MNKTGKSATCSILIPSCDKYSDLWPPFFNMFWRNWRDCPYPVYLGSNKEAFEHPKVENILVGPDKDWTSGVRKMVETLDSEYVLIMLEDFFIRKPVDTKRVVFYVNLLKELGGDLLRLRPPIYRPFLRVNGCFHLAQFMKGAPYIVSLQPTVWKKVRLLSIMRDGESAWEFELKGTRRCNREFGKYFTLRKDCPIEWKTHVVERGKWFLTEARRFRKSGIGCDFSRRAVMTLREQVSWTINKKISMLQTRFIPWTVRERISKIIRRLVKGVSR